jgi:hypothetical protein
MKLTHKKILLRRLLAIEVLVLFTSHIDYFGVFYNFLRDQLQMNTTKIFASPSPTNWRKQILKKVDRFRIRAKILAWRL